MSQLSRRQFLRGDVRSERRAIRPPWALPEASFVERCTACGECLNHCAQQILHTGSGGYPQVDFGRGECTFCAECVRVCASGALRLPQSANDTPPWSVKAVVGESCLPLHGIVCGTCGEHCETSSIRMQLQKGGISVPVVQADDCNGCGACVRVCPAQAIKVI